MERLQTTEHATQQSDATGVARLPVICTGGRFTRPPAGGNGSFPGVILAQTAAFTFTFAHDTDDALRQSRDNPNAPVFIDCDGEPLDRLLDLVRDLRAARPSVRVILFSRRADDRMRRLMRAGADWHFTTTSPALRDLRRALERTAPAAATDPTPVNPYVVGRPLTGASAALYVGRDALFRRVAQNLLAAEPNPMLLTGERRSGKTSTLYQIVEGDRGRALRENPRRPVRAIFLDLQRLAGCATDEWLGRLAADLRRRAGLGRAATNGASGFAVLEEALDDLEASLPAEGLALLALDEADEPAAGVVSGRLSPAVVPFLRAQMQHRRRIVFLLCGSPALGGAFWDTLRTLADRSEIGPLSRDELDSLVRQPVADWLRYEDAVVEHIWALTGGRPYPAQVICRRLVAEALEADPPRRAVTPDDLARVLPDLSELIAPDAVSMNPSAMDLSR